MRKGILYIVPTPIGYLEDITLRAIKVLKSVAMIGAEDTRTSGKLLKKYEIETPMFSYHKFNERERVEKILHYLKNGENVAIISNAGTPGISDPANVMIKSAIENNIKVETLPGATAFVPALISSGFETTRFYFIGFLPQKKLDKEQLLQNLKSIEDCLIFYEAPLRLEKFFQEIKKHFGNRRIVIAREISKIYETYYRTTLDEILDNPETVIPKGEFVIIIEGAKPRRYQDQELLEMLKDYIDNGESKKDAITKVHKLTGEAKNKIYDLMLELGNE